MSLGCVLFFVLGEWLFFYVFLLIGKCLFLNIIKVSGNENFVIIWMIRVLWYCIDYGCVFGDLGMDGVIY